MSIRFVQSNTLFLAGSGVIIGATSIVLTTLTDIYGNALSMTDFGSKGFITLEPDTNNEEAATFSGIIANSNGTYTLTGVKTGLARSPYTETSGLVRSHAGGTKVVITDNVEFWNTFTNKNNDELVEGQWTFTYPPVSPTDNPDASTTVKGITKLSVAPASATSPIAVGTNDNRVLVGFAVDSVGTDSYAITPSPAITAYAAGQVFTFKAGTANTGAATLAVSGLSAIAIKKNVSEALNTGDILANQIVVVEYDGTNMQLLSKTPTLTPVVNTYLTSGSPHTWTKPAGLKYVVVEVQAAGGGGQYMQNAAIGKGGGGGGGYSKITVAAASLGATETVTTGAHGTGGTSGAQNGTDGGNSSFGAWATATGGSKGSTTSGGGAASGDINITGQNGGKSLATGGTDSIGGAGGDSILGLGAAAVSDPAAGNAATGYGGGGGSGAGDNAGQDHNGGNGSDGIVIVTEYY